MRVSSMNFKIRKSVVLFIAIYMVDNFSFFKQSSQIMLHDKPVFKNLVVVGVGVFRSMYLYISAFVNYLATLPVVVVAPRQKTSGATVRAKGLLPTSKVSELLVAILTSKPTLSRFVVTDPRTSSFLGARPSILTGRGLVLGNTNITNILHKCNYSTDNVWRTV